MAQKQTKTITYELAKTFRDAFGFYEEGQQKTVYNSKSRVFKENGYTFTSSNDVLKELQKFGVSEDLSVKEAQVVLENWYNDLLKQQSSNEIPAPGYVSNTTLTPDQLKDFGEFAEKRAQQNADIRAREKQTIDDFIKGNEERIAKAKSLQDKLKDKVVYAKVIIPEQEKLNQDEQQILETLKKYATDERVSDINDLTPKQVLINDLSIKIEEILEPDLKNLTQEEKLVVAQTYAVKLVEEITKPTIDYIIPVQTAILAAIPKEIDSGSGIIQKSISDDPLLRQAKEGSMVLELENRNNQFTQKEIAKRIFGDKITPWIFGVDPAHITVIFADRVDREQLTYIVNFDHLNKEYEKVLDRQNKFIGEVKRIGVENIQNIFISEGRTLIKDKVTKSAVGKLISKDPVLNAIFAQNVLGDHVVWQAISQNRLTQVAVKLSPKIAGPVLGLFGKATPVITKAAGQAAGKVATQVAVKKGISGLIAKGVAFFAGLPAGPAGWVASIIGGELLSRVVENIGSKLRVWWTENKDKAGPAIAVGLGFGGLVLGGPAVGGLVLLGGLAATGTLAVAATGAFGVLGFIGRSVGIAIATPVIITLLVIPPLVAFIMLVINNSAYVVPPDARSLGLNVDNPYILVTKVANPDKFANPTTGKVTVTYTVTIKALKSPLSNISITETTCKVSKKNASTILKCPPELENVPPLPSGLTVSPTSPYSFTFTSEFDSKYADSSIFDAIKIKATVENKEIETSGSESVCVGDCPHGCFEISDDNEPWPDFGSKLEGATQRLTSEFPSFVDQACNGRDKVKLCYTTSNPTPNGTSGLCSGAIYAITSQVSDDEDRCVVNFNQCVFEGGRTDNDVFFLLTHELSHHIQWRDGGNMINKYENAGGPGELPLCSYNNTAGNSDEGSAEANALYANGGVASFSTCLMNFQSQYPNNYNYAQSYMNNP